VPLTRDECVTSIEAWLRRHEEGEKVELLQDEAVLSCADRLLDVLADAEASGASADIEAIQALTTMRMRRADAGTNPYELIEALSLFSVLASADPDNLPGDARQALAGLQPEPDLAASYLRAGMTLVGTGSSADLEQGVRFLRLTVRAARPSDPDLASYVARAPRMSAARFAHPEIGVMGRSKRKLPSGCGGRRESSWALRRPEGGGGHERSPGARVGR
jgi:hypothetical protein